MQIVKIVLGVLVLMAGLGNIPGAFGMANPRQAAGYLISTFFFIIVGAWLLHSGIRHNRDKGKVLDLSDDTEE